MFLCSKNAQKCLLNRLSVFRKFWKKNSDRKILNFSELLNIKTKNASKNSSKYCRYLFFRFRFWFKRIGVDEKHLSWLLVIIKTAFFDFFQIFSAGNDGWYSGNGESTSNLNKDWDNNTKTAQHWRLSSCSPDPTTKSKTTVWLSNAMMSWRKSSGGPWETSCGGFSVK